MQRFSASNCWDQKLTRGFHVSVVWKCNPQKWYLLQAPQAVLVEKNFRCVQRILYWKEKLYIFVIVHIILAQLSLFLILGSKSIHQPMPIDCIFIICNICTKPPSSLTKSRTTQINLWNSKNLKSLCDDLLLRTTTKNYGCFHLWDIFFVGLEVTSLQAR